MLLLLPLLWSAARLTILIWCILVKNATWNRDLGSYSYYWTAWKIIYKFAQITQPAFKGFSSSFSLFLLFIITKASADYFDCKPFRPFTVFSASLSFVVFLHSALTMTDKFSGIFKDKLPALIERRFCRVSYSLAAVFTVCVMKIKRENMVFNELLFFRIFTLFLNAASS